MVLYLWDYVSRLHYCGMTRLYCGVRMVIIKFDRNYVSRALLKTHTEGRASVSLCSPEVISVLPKQTEEVALKRADINTMTAALHPPSSDITISY